MKKGGWCITLMLILCFSREKVSAQASYSAGIKAFAGALYQSLDPIQKRNAVLSFQDTARLQWNNLPIGLRARAGTPLSGMNDDQRKLVHRILSTSLSSQGYLKSTSIIHLDELLNKYYEGLHHKKAIADSVYAFIQALQWSPGNYFFAFFGNPLENTWGYKLEGHHLSVNFTFSGEKVSATPFFMGTDPAEYPESDYAGLRVLGQEEDLGIRLITMLSAEQQKKATQSGEAPQDIITAAESGKRLIDYWGLKAAEMKPEQQAVLQAMIREYVFNLEYDKALMEYDKILKAGIGEVYFGWIGPYEEKKPHYFVINGPTFLIEFDNNGGPRNAANHVHTIWREKGNEYGEDLLKNHYKAEKH
jgi:hypothetical protein